MQTLTMMNRTHEVCTVAYDDDVHAITGIIELLDGAAHGPVGILDDPREALSKLSAWWGRRSIPASRPNITQSLSALGFSSTLELPELNHGLSLSDQYWARKPDSDTRWETINYFNNTFSDAAGRLLFGGVGAALPKSLDTPDNTSDGILPKRWALINGVRSLIKGGGFLNQEPYNEVVATKLYERLLAQEDFVAYELLSDDGVVCSVCPNMLADDEEYVPAAYINALLPRLDGEDEFGHYLACCKHLGIDVETQVSKMLVCDYLLANHDRHYHNFGLIRNVDTLAWRSAPVFDSGSSLWCDVRALSPDSLAYRSLPFVADPQLQLELVRDFSWFDPEALVGFLPQMIALLKEGPLRNYTMRLITIEDSVDERIDRLIDRAYTVAEKFGL